MAVAVAGTVALSARMPASVDGEVYLFQARLLASGHLGTGPLPYPGFFHYYFLVSDAHGALYGAFPPGWPAVLAAGVWLGAAWLVAPLLTGLLVWLGARLAHQVLPLDRGVAPLTAWLLAASPFVLAHGAIFMSHILAANLTLGALILAYRARTGGWLPALVVGLLVGTLFTVRPLNAIVLGLVVVGIGLWQAPRVPALRVITALVLAALPASGYLLANQAVTGHALTPGQDAYFARTEPNERCHRLGFGFDVGCANAHNLERPGYTGKDAVRVTGQRLEELGKKGLGPGLALLLPLALLWRRPSGSATAIAALGVLQLGAYALFYYHGNFLGPRLLFEAFVPLVVLVAAGALKLGWIGVALCLSGLVGGHQLVAVESEHLRWLPYAETAELLSEAEGDRKLVFVDNRGLQGRWRWTHYSLGMVLGEAPGPDATTLFVHDQSPTANATLIDAYPDHTPYQLRLTPGESPLDVAPSLIPLPRHPRAQVSIALSGRFPLSSRGACGFAEPAMPPGVRAHVLRLEADVSREETCRFDLGPGPDVDGPWAISMTAYASPAGGQWRLLIGDEPAGSPFLLSGRSGALKRISVGRGAGAAGARMTLVGRGTADLLELRFRPLR